MERHTRGGKRSEVVEGKLMDLDDKPGLKQSRLSWLGCVSLQFSSHPRASLLKDLGSEAKTTQFKLQTKPVYQACHL